MSRFRFAHLAILLIPWLTCCEAPSDATAVGNAASADAPVLADDDAADTDAPAGTDGSAGTDGWAGSDGWAGTLATPQSLFDPKGLHLVDVTLAPADWQAYLAGVALPMGKKTYQWYPAQVTWNGQPYAQVGIRGFGNGSQVDNPQKPNIRLKFDHFVDKADGPSKVHSVRLKAAGQDPSFVREPLAYDLLRSIGGHAPRWGWARVRVNGEDHGLYQVLEQPDKRMYHAVFGNKDGNEYQPESSCLGFDCPKEGCAALPAYWSGDPGDVSELVALAEDVSQASDAALLGVLQARLHLDDVLAAYAIDAVLSNVDGLPAAGRNLTLYVTPDDKRIHVILHGADLTFGNFGAWYDLASPWGPPNGWCKNRVDRLYQRLWQVPATRALLFDKLRALQCGPLSAGQILPRIVALEAQLTPLILDDPKREPSTAHDVADAFEDLAEYVIARQTSLKALLGPCPP